MLELIDKRLFFLENFLLFHEFFHLRNIFWVLIIDSFKLWNFREGGKLFRSVCGAENFDFVCIDYNFFFVFRVCLFIKHFNGV